MPKPNLRCPEIPQAKRTLATFYQSLSDCHPGSNPAEEHPTTAGEGSPDPIVLRALADDLNVSSALARLHGLSRELQRTTNAAESVALRGSLLASGRLLGLLQQEPNKALHALQAPSQAVPAVASLTNEEISELQDRRQRARQAGEFQLADQLRQRLLEAGVQVSDSKTGSRKHQQPLRPSIANRGQH